MDNALNAWLKTCCPHPNLEYCVDRVGNWPAVRLFSEYASRFDDGRLVLLRNLMPACNGGQVESADAQRCLDELDVMRTLVEGRTAYFLSDAITGEEVRQYVAAYGGLITMTPSFSSGFDPDGLFVKNPDEVFRAMRVSQRVIGDGQGTLEWVGDNGARFVGVKLGLGIGDGDREWQVTSRPLVWADVPCVEPLTRLLRASVEIDMPVYWW